MKAHTASLINAIVLIVIGAWGYFGSETPSITALIPVAVGVILLALNGGVKKENKTIAHIAVVLTLLILISLIKPLMGKINGGDTMGILRIALMMISSAIAMVAFIKSFKAARLARESS